MAMQSLGHIGAEAAAGHRACARTEMCGRTRAKMKTRSTIGRDVCSPGLLPRPRNSVNRCYNHNHNRTLLPFFF
jgi:hypothetical protein